MQRCGASWRRRARPARSASVGGTRRSPASTRTRGRWPAHEGTRVPTALLDISMLSVASTRTRGIGRYAVDLERTLAARARQRHDWRIFVVEGLHYLGAADVTDDVDGAIGRLRRHAVRRSKAW